MHTLVTSVVVAALCASCASNAHREASISVEVVDDQGQALPSVPILVDDTPIANTDESGHAQAVVQAQTSAPVRVIARCGDDFRPAEARRVTLSRVERKVRPLRLRMICAPKLRSVAVVVRAPGGEGLTLRADGAPIAKVAPDGTAHVLLKRAPDTSLRLSLDTTEAPTLVPQFPAREVHVADRDEIVVFDQTLVARVAALRRPKAKAAVSPEMRHVPYAIGRSD